MKGSVVDLIPYHVRRSGERPRRRDWPDITARFAPSRATTSWPRNRQSRDQRCVRRHWDVLQSIAPT